MSDMESFKIIRERTKQVPIIISVPHCGIGFPEEIKNDYRQDLIGRPDDTDWYVDQLYDFAPKMGMRMITSNISRWVIDLNRDPNDRPLYGDGRLITGLCPTTTFTGEKLYNDGREAVNAEEVARRIKSYYEPYHHALQEMLNEALDTFGKVLLWDCHSIRRRVPSIHAEPFPDLILGDNEGKSADTQLTQTASKQLSGSRYSFKNNYLFKGGFITRRYGNPSLQQHALQLEMSKDNYMDDEEISYDPSRAGRMREHLQRVFEQLIMVLS